MDNCEISEKLTEYFIRTKDKNFKRRDCCPVMFKCADICWYRTNEGEPKSKKRLVTYVNTTENPKEKLRCVFDLDSFEKVKVEYVDHV